MPKSPKRDPYREHEALDRAHLLCSMFYEYVATHPAVKRSVRLRSKADALCDALAEFYQDVGHEFDDGLDTARAVRAALEAVSASRKPPPR